MKKFIVLTIVSVFSLVSCGSSPDVKAQSPPTRSNLDLTDAEVAAIIEARRSVSNVSPGAGVTAKDLLKVLEAKSGKQTRVIIMDIPQ